MATRTQVAQYVASNIKSGNIADRQKAIKISANWLKKSGKSRQSEYLVRDITVELEKSGYLYVIVTSARQLEEKTVDYLKQYLKNIYNVNNLELDIRIDQDLIGGLKIETPVGTLDNSVKARLAKIVEGVSE